MAAPAAHRETIALVPHTHWDREWYEPFQRFRLRLVDLLDDVVSRAEADPAFRFTLDGQMAAVDDYLEVRPELTRRIANLVRRGQLAIGPWAILLDEFLCSGENIVRNLELGIDRAAALGGHMPVGYLPDMFGHCAQMPQILALAGLRQACVWRGVPAAIERHAFRWEAPDGTAVRCEYLPAGYGNAAHLFFEPERLAERSRDLARRMRPWFGTDQVLAMYGTDHSAPLPTLVASVAALEESTSPVRLELRTLAEHLAANGRTEDLPVWRGELRSHARANILPGVLSNRIHLKRAMAAAELMVERYAEPLAALWSPAGAWPAKLLEMAWTRLVQCSCHDSVTGCGADATAQQVAARIAEAEQLGSGIRDRVVGGLVSSVPHDAVLVVNPSPYPRTAVVAVDAALPEPWPAVALELPDGTRLATQQVGANEQDLYTTTVGGPEFAESLRLRSFGPSIVGRWIRRWEVTGARRLSVHVGRMPDRDLDFGRSADEVAALVDRDDGSGSGPWTVRVVDEPVRSLLAEVPVPALGNVSARVVAGPGSPPRHRVRAGDGTLDNGLVAIRVEVSGTLSIRAADGTVVRGAGRIVDGGDAGDLYNYAPADGDVLVDTPVQAAVETVETGPLLGVLEVVRGYRWRGGLTPVRMRIELRAGEPFCRLLVAFENRQPDHRVRLHVPLAAAAARSFAEGQFAVVSRGLTGEGGHGEEPLPTFPAYGFVDAGGVAVLLAQATEYELVGDGTELALTLLRATGQISRSMHPYRAEPAGPEVPTPQAQCLGPVETSLAILPHAGDWSTSGVLAAAEAFRCGFVAAQGTGDSALPLVAATGMRVEGDGVVMTSLRRREDWLELRLAALHPTATTAVVVGIAAARTADLLGRPGEPLRVVDGMLTLPMRPWEIATLQVQR